MGRVQYVDIDKEGLDPKVSGSMASKRIHEDSLPYIKVDWAADSFPLTVFRWSESITNTSSK